MSKHTFEGRRMVRMHIVIHPDHIRSFAAVAYALAVKLSPNIQPKDISCRWGSVNAGNGMKTKAFWIHPESYNTLRALEAILKR
jgi:hypothetical protein